jgi:hypothetical protein
MPLITDLIKKEVNTKFKKKEYRPWDLSITNPSEENLKSEPSNTHEARNIAKEIAGNEGDLNVTIPSPLNLEKEWRNLYGAKKDVLIYMIKKIEEDNDNRIITKNITLEQLVNELQLPPNTIKGALQQLKKSNLLYTEENKPGRGGYARYRILKNVYTFFEAKIKNI